MADIKTQSLLYHLTDITNLEAIFTGGLKPRSELQGFSDVADSEILDGRKVLELEKKVPFHFFAKNPFDGRVQLDHPNKDFVLITVHRSYAKANNWSIIPRHPLADEDIELLGYDAGMDKIDWSKMNDRDYHDHDSKSVCMAECLSPVTVEAVRFYSIFTKTEETHKRVLELKTQFKLGMYVNLQGMMFSA
jgi:hypothetical protein